MEKWQYEYDKMLSNPPEPKEVIGGYCEHCGEELLVGEEVIRESATDYIFCDRDCAEKYIKENIEDYLDIIYYNEFTSYEVEE